MTQINKRMIIALGQHLTLDTDATRVAVLVEWYRASSLAQRTDFDRYLNTPGNTYTIQYNAGTNTDTGMEERITVVAHSTDRPAIDDGIVRLKLKGEWQ